jgi:hypothetical protein
MPGLDERGCPFSDGQDGGTDPRLTGFISEQQIA